MLPVTIIEKLVLDLFHNHTRAFFWQVNRRSTLNSTTVMGVTFARLLAKFTFAAVWRQKLNLQSSALLVL